MNKDKKIGYAGCKNTTLECMSRIIKLGYKIDSLITLSYEQGRKAEVAGYCDLRHFAYENGIEIYYPHKYSLLDDNDRQNITAMNLDLLLVIGWQRLIPDWLLKSLSIGAFGMHGSSEPLPAGRGRSPLNWSLIQDKKRFITHLIRYKPEVDNGDIIDIMVFDITPFDTCHTLHLKNMVSMSRLLEIYLPSLLDGSDRAIPQSDKGASYYPKRTPDDGIIDWNQSSLEIYNLVRAVTFPFYGAFSFLGDDKVTIWQAIPFDYKIRYPDRFAGEIVEVFCNGQFVVNTGDASLLVLEYEIKSQNGIKVGNRFHNGGLDIKEWGQLPR